MARGFSGGTLVCGWRRATVCENNMEENIV
jgi:hypothetical protein